jgi:hypothetical protein
MRQSTGSEKTNRTKRVKNKNNEEMGIKASERTQAQTKKQIKTLMERGNWGK